MFINTTNIVFSSEEKDVIALDPKFVLPLVRPDVVSHIIGVETGLQQNHLPDVDPARVVSTCTRILAHGMIGARTNTGIPTRAVVRRLQLRLAANGAMLVKADKGNKSCVMTVDDYNNKCMHHFNNRAVYEKVPNSRNPVLSTRTKLHAALKPLKDRGGMSKATFCNNILPTVDCCALPKPYALIKIHKANYPARIIVPGYDFVTFTVSKLIHKLLTPSVLKSVYRINSATDFVSQLRSAHVHATSVMVSFDVTALFDNIDIDHFIQCLPGLLGDSEAQWRILVPQFACLSVAEIVNVCTIVFNSSYLHFGDFIFRQCFGTPMGSPCSVYVSECAMALFESQLFETCVVSHPVLYARYIDDVFLLFDHVDHIEPFLRHANSINARLQFTHEHEHNATLPFLDILVHRHADHLDCSVYRKPTNSGRHTHWHSCTPPSVHRALAQSLRLRALRYCTTEDALAREMNTINGTLRNNGFPADFVDRVLNPAASARPPKDTRPRMYLPFNGGVSRDIRRHLDRAGINVCYKRGSTLENALYYKSGNKPDDMQRRNVIYECACAECGKTYIGETSRRLCVRTNEHTLDGKPTSKKGALAISGISLHMRETGHTIGSTQVIASESSRPRLRVREALAIQTRAPQLNDNDGHQLSQCWASVMHLL